MLKRRNVPKRFNFSAIHTKSYDRWILVLIILETHKNTDGVLVFCTGFPKIVERDIP